MYFKAAVFQLYSLLQVKKSINFFLAKNHYFFHLQRNGLNL